MRAATSKPAGAPAVLVLEDGAVFVGTSCGAPGEAFGEICFNTSLEGYLGGRHRSRPTPGRSSRITYPQVGNYGVNRRRRPGGASRPCAALVVRDMCPRALQLAQPGLSLARLPGAIDGVVAVEGVDTRALVRHVRDHAAPSGPSLSTDDADVAAPARARCARASPSLVGENQVAAAVSCDEAAYAVRRRRTCPSRHSVRPVRARRARVPPRGRLPLRREALHPARTSCARAASSRSCPGTPRPKRCWPWPPTACSCPTVPGDPEAVEGDLLDRRRSCWGQVPAVRHLPRAPDDRQGRRRRHRQAQVRPPRRQPPRDRTCSPAAWRSRPRTTASARRFPSSGRARSPSSPAARHGPRGRPARLGARQGVAPVVANPRFGRIRLTHVNLERRHRRGRRLPRRPRLQRAVPPRGRAPVPTDAHYLFTAFGRLMDGREDYLDIDIADRPPRPAGPSASRPPPWRGRKEASHAQARRHQDHPRHRDRPHRHRPGLRVRLLRRPGLQGAAAPTATASCSSTANPATIMTDPGLADRHLRGAHHARAFVEQVIAKERPDALPAHPRRPDRPQHGRRPRAQVRRPRASYGVELIGCDLAAIERGEDRKLFNECMADLGIEDVAEPATPTPWPTPRRIAGRARLSPWCCAPRSRIGGAGGGIARDRGRARHAIVAQGLELSPAGEVLVEETIEGWKEYEMEVMRDAGRQRHHRVLHREPRSPWACTPATPSPWPPPRRSDRPGVPAHARRVARRPRAASAWPRAAPTCSSPCNPDDGPHGRHRDEPPRVALLGAWRRRPRASPSRRRRRSLAVGYTLDEIVNDITGRPPRPASSPPSTTAS